MGKLDRVQVEHVARLAKLPISSSELTKFGGQLGKIVEYVGMIAKRKTKNVKRKTIIKQSLTSLKDLKVSRKDRRGSGECLSQEEAVSNAKNVHSGLFETEAVFGE